MNSLASIKEEAARIAVAYGNGRINASLTGAGNIEAISDENIRVTYLWAIINSAYEQDGVVYLGSTAVTDAYIQEAMSKLWHYSGKFSSVDLSDYTTIVADNGEGEAVSPTAPTTNDNMRVGSMTVVAGANPVTFLKDGVASPLSSSDYTVVAWVISQSGYMQNNVVVTGQVASGFVASDVLEAGTLYYNATLNT